MDTDCRKFEGDLLYAQKYKFHSIPNTVITVSVNCAEKFAGGQAKTYFARSLIRQRATFMSDIN